jgi:predicted amidophosphoribosyltransferase
MARCPVCARRITDEEQCPRCGCALGETRAVCGAAVAAAARARFMLAQGERRHALTWAEKAWRLHQTSDHAALAFLAASSGGLTEDALRWRRRAAEGPPPRAPGVR